MSPHLCLWYGSPGKEGRGGEPREQGGAGGREGERAEGWVKMREERVRGEKVGR